MLPPGPLIYLITNSRQFDQHGGQTGALAIQLEVIVEASMAGCQLVQIREKHLSPRELLIFAATVVDAVRGSGTKVLINDRADIALAAGADGVHLRTDSMPVAAVRTLAQCSDLLIAVSTHNSHEARLAEEGGASFIVTGPVFPTVSKVSTGEIGLSGLQTICSTLSIPVLALGGITVDNFRSALESGAAGVAAIGLFSDPGTAAGNVKQIRTAG